ncbi:MAG: D-alanyl-D-alanine carboxypeptidase [Oscillospiraceae bacterium]|nr:D-alanyl-D-alanine carboxypeptidase [Oscillospiraceae bacterium]
MTLKKEYRIILALLLAALFSLRASAAGVEEITVPAATSVAGIELAQANFDITAKAGVLMSSDTGDILYEKNADEPLAIASITKVMTLLLTFEAIDAGKITLQDVVPVSEHAYSMGGSQIWLEPGEHFTLDELVKAICVSSANDAAVAVAEYVGGSEDVFATMMNDRAAQLGMTNTHFMNACGLDEDGHLSTARDVALMSLELMKHKKVFEYTGIWTDSLRDGQTQLVNTNKLLKRYNGITGLKTGTTGKAGVCISATATRDGTGFIAVVLGSSNSAERFQAATDLLDYGFATYETAEFPALASSPQTAEVAHGETNQVPLTYAVPEKLLVKKGESTNLSADITMQPITAPVEKDTQVGEITLKMSDQVLQTYPIKAAETVEKMSFKHGMSILWKHLMRL